MASSGVVVGWDTVTGLFQKKIFQVANSISSFSVPVSAIGYNWSLPLFLTYFLHLILRTAHSPAFPPMPLVHWFLLVIVVLYVCVCVCCACAGFLFSPVC